MSSDAEQAAVAAAPPVAVAPRSFSSAYPDLNCGSLQSIDRLRRVMSILRTSCPWVGRQTPLELTRYAIEEAYEVEDAVRKGDAAEVRDELGDLLFQVIFQSEMFSEGRYGNPDAKGVVPSFAFDDVADAITKKLIRRNPQLFNTPPAASTALSSSAEDASAVWQQIKREEAALKEEAASRRRQPASLMDAVKHGPALSQAESLLRVMESAGVDMFATPPPQQQRYAGGEKSVAAVPPPSSQNVSLQQRQRALAAIAQVESDMARLKASLMEGDGEGKEEADDGTDCGSNAQVEASQLLGDALLSLVAVGRALPLPPSSSLPLASRSTSSSAVEEALLAAIDAKKSRFVVMERLAREGGDTLSSTPSSAQRLWEDAENAPHQ